MLNRKAALMYRSDGYPANMRKARVHCLIQAGAMIHKAGLFECVGLEVGDDLQRDPETFESAATLMGALLSLKEIFTSEDADVQKMLWTARGKEALAKR